MLENKIDRIERNVKKVEQEQESIAMSLLNDYKGLVKKLVVIILVLIVGLIGSNAYWIYEYTHTSVEEDTRIQDIDDIDSLDGANITNGDIYGEN